MCKHGRQDHPQNWVKGDEWAFNSPAWKEANFINVYLKTIHRQRDPRFLELLNRCRFGTALSNEDVRLIARPEEPHNPSYLSAVRLLCVNRDVDQVNLSEFNKLTTPDIKAYLCLDHFEWVKGEHMGRLNRFTETITDYRTGHTTLKEFKDHRLPDELQLRTGTVVALITNLDLAAGLCNGSQGIVVGFERFDSTPINAHIKSMDKAKAKLIKAWVNQIKPSRFPIVRFNATHGRPTVQRTIYPECFISNKKDTGSELLLSRAQIPLIQSWASESPFFIPHSWLNRSSC